MTWQGQQEEGHLEIEVGGDCKPYIPAEGIYPARFEGIERVCSPWGDKLKAQWTVFTCRKMIQSVVLYRYYNGTRGLGGRLKFGPNHDFYRDWTSMNNGVPPRRSDRFPVSGFKNQEFFVLIVTVKDNGRHAPLNPGTYYSKVGGVVRPLGEEEQVGTLPLQLVDIGWKKP